MSDILVRGLAQRDHVRLQKLAEAQDLSVNQYLLRMIRENLEGQQTAEEKERERQDVFRRIDELRERLRREYGKQEDSVKIIRELRDSR